MASPRIFYPGELEIGKLISLPSQASQHLVKVLRLNTGDPVIVFNGKGDQFRSQIKAIRKDSVDLEILAVESLFTESPLAINLGQGISRGEKMDFTIQKAVELGVKQITPLLTQRCNVHLDLKRQTKRVEHWQRIVESACEQSGRGFVPEVSKPVTLTEWVHTIRGVALVCDPEASQLLSKINIPEINSEKSIHILIGPEGGLSAEEILVAEKAHFKRVSLGPRVLRTETAALVALTILQSRWGDI